MSIETIGVRDLKNSATRVVRAVREDHAEYVITLHGEPVAVLRPYTNEDDERLRTARVESYLAELDELAHDIGTAWTSEKSGVALVDEQRRG